jgi:4,5-DOPA dioxygenase extradiol
MSTFPSVFVSHGSPDLPLQPSPSLDFLKQLGIQLNKPKAILVISAHWQSHVPTVSTATEVKIVHDFWGFPADLYQIDYSPPGAPELAEQVTKLLTKAGFEYEVYPDRELDHGAWEPLMLMYPQADIPVTQLSIQPHLGTNHHRLLGRALASLRQEGVLILASGTTTHNLRAFGAYPFDAPPPDWVTQFDQWLAEVIANNNFDALLNYRRLAPYAAKNHPTEEHLLPLFVALGAGGPEVKGTQLHSSFTYGVLSMAAYAFAA